MAANHWMTRIVDAAGAIAARGYPPGARAEVHLQLADRVAPWNDGRFVLRIEGGEAKLTPGGTGDVHLSVNGLASLYTGWATAAVLAGPESCTTPLIATSACWTRPSPDLVPTCSTTTEQALTTCENARNLVVRILGFLYQGSQRRGPRIT